MSKNLALFALDCFVQVPEPCPRARGPRLPILCPTKRSDPSHNTVPMCRAGVRAGEALGAVIVRAQAGAGRAPGFNPSTTERRCSVPVAPPPPLPLVCVRGAPEACHRGGSIVRIFFYLINR